MRIGVMLRAYGEAGGIGVYTRNLVEELLRIDQHNEYFLYYHDPRHLGKFSQHANVQERRIRALNKAIWDQVTVPFACKRDHIDVVFHPKFTVPLLAPCAAVMTVHGADWFMPDQAQFYHPLDVAYIRTVMPLYFRKCHTVISVSQLTTDNFQEALKLPPDKIQTVYFAPARHFRRITDTAELNRVRQDYNLPERFILTLTKRSGGDRRKNLGQIFKAYARYHAETEQPHKLVIGGKDCHLFREEYGLPATGYGKDILFPGWLDQCDLPAIYSMADLYLYPSRLEAFPIPITEAMACGTPIITSNSNGLQEIAGDAAILVDPDNTMELATAIGQVLNDTAMRQELASMGLQRSARYDWGHCARQTLALLEAAGQST